MTVPMSPPAIRARGLDVVLGSTTVLRNIDLTVAQGDAVVLLGENGSGKSTLVKALLGIVPVDSGSVRLWGVDVATARQDVPWGDVGYVPQRAGASTGVPATALEVVSSGLLDRRRLRPGRDARRKCLEALDQVGLADRARESVQIFSGGQQQRLLIARALVRRPRLLILDEPISGIDQASKEALAHTLEQLQHEGITIVMVLHEIGELAGLLERAVVLRRGRVVHDGTPPPPAPGHDHPGHDHVHPHADAPPVAHAAPHLYREQ